MSYFARSFLLLIVVAWPGPTTRLDRSPDAGPLWCLACGNRSRAVLEKQGFMAEFGEFRTSARWQRGDAASMGRRDRRFGSGIPCSARDRYIRPGEPGDDGCRGGAGFHAGRKYHRSGARCGLSGNLTNQRVTRDDGGGEPQPGLELRAQQDRRGPIAVRAHGPLARYNLGDTENRGGADC